MEWERVFGMGGGIWKKIPLLFVKIVVFGKIVVIEFIDMSGVIVETLLYTSGIWEKAVKLLRVTVEFESNTMRAESPSGV